MVVAAGRPARRKFALVFPCFTAARCPGLFSAGSSAAVNRQKRPADRSGAIYNRYAKLWKPDMLKKIYEYDSQFSHISFI